MNVTQITNKQSRSGEPRCANCDAILPKDATFCGTCGARIDEITGISLITSDTDIAEHYRMTSLIRTQPYVKLFLAIDQQHQRPVLIRDINVTTLKGDTQIQAIDTVMSEYDLLRHLSMSDVMPLIDLRYYQGHLFSVAEWPGVIDSAVARHAYTLDDLLQSGIGLPDEGVAVAWIHRLCQAVEGLHEQQIVIGNLDPHVIVVSQDSYEGTPALAVSWLPLPIRALLPNIVASSYATHFMAPEALQGNMEPGCDVYSLGALLYLLLTGTAPEDSPQRKQHPLRSPQELNASVNSAIASVVMRALELDSTARWQSAHEMAEALSQATNETEQRRLGLKAFGIGKPRGKSDITSDSEDTQAAEDEDDVTISPTQLQAQLARLQQVRKLTKKLRPLTRKKPDEPTMPAPHAPEIPESPESEEEPQEPQVVQPSPSLLQQDILQENPPQVVSDAGEQDSDDAKTPRKEETTVRLSRKYHPISSQTDDMSRLEVATETAESPPEAAQPAPQTPYAPDTPQIPRSEMDAGLAQQEYQEQAQHIEEILTVSLPMTPTPQRPQVVDEDKRPQVVDADEQPQAVDEEEDEGQPQAVEKAQEPFLKRLQHFILGEQQHATAAAALIETPMRIQPDQIYSIRIHIMGRNERKGLRSGVSGLARGETVHIEVRSALVQNYAYIVQQADVQVPGRGYAAEVTMPMHPLSNNPAGRRERLHIFFMDRQRRPLYEKPFAIEIFISHLVQAGREGHNVLTIPL